MAGRRPESGQQERKKSGKCEKDVKIEGTNSISPLESTKVSKNELKTNWFLSAKRAKRTQKSGQKNAFVVALKANLASGPTPLSTASSWHEPPHPPVSCVA
jgi:hypothetical protein